MTDPPAPIEAELIGTLDGFHTALRATYDALTMIAAWMAKVEARLVVLEADRGE